MKNKYQEFDDTQLGKQENYKSFVLPNCGVEFVKNEEDLEESRAEDRSNVRSGVDSDVNGDVRRGVRGDVKHADREEVLYNPIQTAPSQNEFLSSTTSRRPTRSTVRPSRFRDAAFETQFQPGRKKVRKLCYRPGGGAFRECSSVDRVCDPYGRHRYCGWWLHSGRGDQISVNKGVPKQTRHSRSSLIWYCSGRRPVLGRRYEPIRRWPTRFKFQLKRYRWRRKENGGDKSIRLEYSIRFIPESIRCMRGTQPEWPHYCFRLKKSEVKAAIQSDVVKNYTRHLQAANDEINLGNLRSESRNTGVLSPNDECEKGESKAKTCDNMLCVRGNNTDNQVSILQLLDTGESSVGAPNNE